MVSRVALQPAAQFLLGDCRETLKTLAAGSVQCVVTSPPYYGLRDYGHDEQIGQEQTPDMYIAELVHVFREVHRTLAKDGVIWINIGDSYNSGTANNHGKGGGLLNRNLAPVEGWAPSRPKIKGLKHKDLIGIPWMLAFALRADGWHLRQECIWAKPNSMPEAVTDRCTRTHEQLFMLSKAPHYYYDIEAIKEKATTAGANSKRKDAGKAAKASAGGVSINVPVGRTCGSPEMRNKRSVWTVTPRPFGGAHFATMPPALVEPCIMAGSRVGDAVLDPFGGSGTTGLVAKYLGRRAIICELNPSFMEIAKKRVAEEHITSARALMNEEANAGFNRFFV